MANACILGVILCKTYVSLFICQNLASILCYKLPLDNMLSCHYRHALRHTTADEYDAHANNFSGHNLGAIPLTTCAALTLLIPRAVLPSRDTAASSCMQGHTRVLHSAKQGQRLMSCAFRQALCSHSWQAIGTHIKLTEAPSTRCFEHSCAHVHCKHVASELQAKGTDSCIRTLMASKSLRCTYSMVSQAQPAPSKVKVSPGCLLCLVYVKSSRWLQTSHTHWLRFI